MAVRRNYEKKRITRYIQVQRLKEILPKEKYFTDNTLYFLYKSNDITYPDVAKITREFYNRSMVECYWGADTMDWLEKFLQYNIEERENVVKLVEELAQLLDIDQTKIEDIFERYKGVLRPIDELYKLCYYLPTLFYALDIRIYKRKPTKINRSFMMSGIINFLKGKITKEEALHIWDQIVVKLKPGEVVDKFTCTIVDKHQRELKSDRFTIKQGETIPVEDHPRIIKKKTKNISF